MPNGLPSFQGLVSKLYKALGEEPDALERLLCRERQYDRVLGRLESRVGKTLRREVASLLRAAKSADKPLHPALLDLARHGDNYRLVTTNFDRLFVDCRGEERRSFEVDSAPKLPVPRKYRWNSVVHLHGLIQDADPGGQNLVLTSGDFGLAYLVDGWAARFVTELVRNFTVVFVGYSVDDPVMRYLTDAIAAESAHATGFRRPYALAAVEGISAEEREHSRLEWEAKGVEPVFYDAYGEVGDHRLLADTLMAWADLHRGGLHSCRNLISKYAGSAPTHAGEDAAKLVLWALSEPDGVVAKHFAELDPPPPLGWLPFLEAKLDDSGKTLLGLPPDPRVPSGEKGHPLAVPLVDWGRSTSGPPPLALPTSYLGEWLVRHLNSPKLLEWALTQGTCLHPELRAKVRKGLKEQDSLSPALRKVWSVLAAEPSVPLRQISLDLKDRIASGAWTPTLRSELRAALRLVSKFTKPSGFYTAYRAALVELGATASAFAEPVQGEKVGDLVSIDLRFGGGDWARRLAQDLPRLGRGRELLADLAEDLTTSLLHSLETLEELEEASNEQDPASFRWSRLDQKPTIPRRDDLVILLQLLLEGFDELVVADRRAANALVERWLHLRFPIFRRLAFHSLTMMKSPAIEPALERLVSQPQDVLWASSCEHEVLRFLRELGGRLRPKDLARLAATLVAGPSGVGLGSASDQEREARDQLVWSRLSALQASGALLPRVARSALAQLEKVYPWKVSDGEGEERQWKVLWRTDDGSRAQAELEALGVAELASRLVDTTSGEGLGADLWKLAEKRPLYLLAALKRLAKQGRWPTAAWQATFRGLSHRGQNRRSHCLFRGFSRVLLGASKNEIERLFREGVSWLRGQASDLLESLEGGCFWPLWDAWCEPALQEARTSDSDPVNEAVNHPAGELAESLLHRLWVRELRRGDGIPEEIRSRLTKLAEAVAESAILARVILASELHALQMLDTDWFSRKLLPRMRWGTPTEAPSLWTAYFWHPRLDPSLLAVIKDELLLTMEHLGELGEARENGCRLFAQIVAESPETFSTEQAQGVLRNLAPEDLANVADTLVDLLHGAGEQSGTLWRERFGPWINEHWPKRQNLRHPDVARKLARMAVASGEEFPRALQVVREFLVPLPDPFGLEEEVKESKQIAQFPVDVLELLSLVVPSTIDPTWAWQELRTLVGRIVAVRPELRDDQRFQRLGETLLKAGR